MAVSPAGFALSLPRAQREISPLELLESALYALNHNSPDKANLCIGQLPPLIASRIFHLAQEESGRSMHGEDRFGKEAFFDHSYDTDFKKGILERVIREQGLPNDAVGLALVGRSGSRVGKLFKKFSSSAGRASAPPTQQQCSPSQMIAHIQVFTGLMPDLGSLINRYAIECFGAAEWRHYFHVDVGDVPELPKSFFDFWDGPDPLDPTQLVCHTHLPLVLRPGSVTDIKTNIQLPYNWKTLIQPFSYTLQTYRRLLRTGTHNLIIGNFTPPGSSNRGGLNCLAILFERPNSGIALIQRYVAQGAPLRRN